MRYYFKAKPLKFKGGVMGKSRREKKAKER